jgi:hypothetical protein
LDVQCYNTHMNKTNDAIQWTGTAFILGMYVISNFFPGYDNLRNAVALVGAPLLLHMELSSDEQAADDH